MTVLNALANAVVSKQIPAKSDTLDKYIDVFAPRLSRALSADVPRAFQAFWRKSFQDLEVDFSDDVRGFLLDVLAAVPGMIEVRGLLPQSSMSEVSLLVLNVEFDMVLKVCSGGEHRAVPQCADSGIAAYPVARHCTGQRHCSERRTGPDGGIRCRHLIIPRRLGAFTVPSRGRAGRARWRGAASCGFAHWPFTEPVRCGFGEERFRRGVPGCGCCRRVWFVGGCQGESQGQEASEALSAAFRGLL